MIEEAVFRFEPSLSTTAQMREASTRRREHFHSRHLLQEKHIPGNRSSRCPLTPEAMACNGTREVLLKLFGVAGRQFIFQCARDRQVKQASHLLLFLSFLENIRVPADDCTLIVTGKRTTL